MITKYIFKGINNIDIDVCNVDIRIGIFDKKSNSNICCKTNYRILTYLIFDISHNFDQRLSGFKNSDL